MINALHFKTWYDVTKPHSKRKKFAIYTGEKI